MYYRFGYQGSEKDNEITGEGNTYTTFFRELDVRTCRWWGIDPKTSATPWESPYVSMGDNPVWYKDIVGDRIWSGKASAEKESDSKEEKERKDKNNQIANEGEKSLLKSLSEKTGLNLHFNDKGLLEYDQNSNGSPLINGGSEAARNDLISGIDDKSFDFTINWVSNDMNVNGGKAPLRDKSANSGWMKLDISDFSPSDNKTFDIGMAFFHEFNHGYFGIDDPAKSEYTVYGPPDMNNPATIIHQGNVGEVEMRVNIYRSQLGLPIRISYNGTRDEKGNSIMPFKNNKGNILWLKGFVD